MSSPDSGSSALDSPAPDSPRVGAASPSPGRATSAEVFRVEDAAPLPAWPVTLMIVAYPLWFLLGLGGFMWVVLAAPMAATLVRRRNLVAPKGLGLWAVFLIAVVGSALGVDSPARFSGYLLRLGYYVGATVFLLYLLNGGRSVSVGRIVRSFTILWMCTIVGGYLALVLGEFSFRSPMYYLLPPVLLDNELINTLVTPGFADVQNIIGLPVPRPKAPFPYTNSWGSMVALSTPFAIIALLDRRSGLSPRLVRLALAASVVPIVVSLNRGLWLSLGLGLLYAGFRFGLAGRRGSAARLVVVALAVAAVVALSPLGDLFTSRLVNGHSDGDRVALATAAVEGTLERPIFGWGTPRPNESGQPSVGTHGQVWMVMFSHGFVGLTAFLGTLFTFWFRTRRQRTTSGVWAHTVLVIAAAQLPVYLMIPHALFAVMGAVALALRYQQEDDRTDDAVGADHRSEDRAPAAL
ncbi:MAG: hypothetical protein AAGA59_17950 [Actinomycetota bacterium]